MAQGFQLKFDQNSPELAPEDDEMDVLDDKILEPMSEDFSDNRRFSYDAPYPYSHRGSDWYNYSNSRSNTLELHPASQSHSVQPVVNSTGAPFMHVDGPQSAYQQTTWAPMQRTDSGSCTPTVDYGQYAADGGQTATAPFAGGAVGPVSAVGTTPMSYRGMAFGSHDSDATSPKLTKQWAMAPTDCFTTRSDSNNGLSCRNEDGKKKRNARFPIPAERTLSNIDHLISQSTNEEEIKELKQQKRLLRNRQAA
jgi:hypothetical protein